MRSIYVLGRSNTHEYWSGSGGESAAELCATNAVQYTFELCGLTVVLMLGTVPSIDAWEGFISMDWRSVRRPVGYCRRSRRYELIEDGHASSHPYSLALTPASSSGRFFFRPPAATFSIKPLILILNASQVYFGLYQRTLVPPPAKGVQYQLDTRISPCRARWKNCSVPTGGIVDGRKYAYPAGYHRRVFDTGADYTAVLNCRSILCTWHTRGCTPVGIKRTYIDAHLQ